MSLGRVDILIKWDLDTIDFFQTSVLRHLEFLAAEAYSNKPEDLNKDGSLTRYSLATGAYKMALNAIQFVGRVEPSETRHSGNV